MDSLDMQEPVDGPEPEGDLRYPDPEGTDPLLYDEESQNLCFDFAEHAEGAQAIKSIADFIVTNYDASRDANKEYLERCARDWRIFSGDLTKKTAPFADCANAHVPIMLENISRLSFRGKDELFGDWSNVVQMVPSGPDDRVQADILTRHLNWQLPALPGMQREQDRGFLIFFTFGEVACHSYYDERLRLNRHEILSPEQITTPYVYVSTALDYSDCPWLAKMQMLYRHELEARRSEYFGVDTLLNTRPPAWIDDPEKRITEVLAESRGLDLEAERRDTQPYQLIWWEGWLTLPNQTEQRYCQCILEYKTRHVLKLRIHEHEEWRDVLRYERQMAELQQYRQATQMHSQQQEQQLGLMEAQGDAVISGAILAEEGPGAEAALIQQLKAAALAPLPPPPTPPGWLRNPEDPNAAPEPPRKVPILMFSHQACIEPLQGNLGLGYGRIEGDYNRAANTALSQFIDQATLSNAQTLITTADVTFKEPFTVGPGKVNVLNNFAGNVRDAIFPVTFGQANAQLLEAVKEFRGYGQAATQVSEVVSGFPGKSGEPFKGLAARLEAATKALSVPTRKYASFFEQIVRNNCQLNSLFLSEEELFAVADDLLPDASQEMRVTRSMYRRDYNVTVKADLRFTSQAQRIQEADEVVGMVNSHPMLAQNAALVYAAYREALEARGKKNLAQLLGPPPPPGAMMPPQQPPQQGQGPQQQQAQKPPQTQERASQ